MWFLNEALSPPLRLPGCLYQGQECRLVIHYEQGFSVLADPSLPGLREDEEKKDAPGRRRPLLSYPFDRLRMSSDDGIRMLLLDFGGEEGEIVSTSGSPSAQTSRSAWVWNCT